MQEQRVIATEEFQRCPNHVERKLASADRLVGYDVTKEDRKDPHAARELHQTRMINTEVAINSMMRVMESREDQIKFKSDIHNLSEICQEESRSALGVDVYLRMKEDEEAGRMSRSVLLYNSACAHKLTVQPVKPKYTDPLRVHLHMASGCKNRREANQKEKPRLRQVRTRATLVDEARYFVGNVSKYIPGRTNAERTIQYKPIETKYAESSPIHYE